MLHCFFSKKVTEQITFDRFDVLSLTNLINFRDNSDVL